MILGRCGLCSEKSELQESHVIPKFVFRHLKATSGTGYLRTGVNPNLRVQDGFKHPMLCHQCEQRFQEWETPFAEQLFRPVHNDSVDSYSYGDWFKRFAVSISWRVLQYLAISNSLCESVDDVHRNAYQQADQKWRDFLLGKSADIGYFAQHVAVFHLVDDLPAIDNIPTNINRYLNRSVEISIGRSQTEAFTYAKMMRIVIFGWIKIEHPEFWRGTEIMGTAAQISKRTALPKSVFQFMCQRAEKQRALTKQLSQKQQAVIDKTYRNNPNALINSDLFVSIKRDVELFGDKAFE